MYGKKISKMLSFILITAVVFSLQYTAPVFAAAKNSPPVISEGKSLALSTTKSKSISFTISAKDSNGDKISFAISKAAKNGTVKLANPTSKGKGSARVYTVKVTYNPKSSFTGSDSFSLIAKDSKGAKSTAITVKVTVKKADKTSDSTDKLKAVELIAPKYESIAFFSEDLARVYKDGKFGYIDLNGKLVIPLKYTSANDFKDGYAQVSIDGKFGYIDKKGKVVIPLKYNWLTDITEGLASFVTDGKYGLVDITGKEIASAKYDKIYGFSNGRAMFILNGKFGFIDKNGKEIVPAKYDTISEFIGDIAVVQYDKKYGIVDKSGKEIIPAEYYTYKKLSDAIIALQKEGPYDRYQLVDTKGNLLSEYSYINVEDFSEGLALVSREDGYGFIDKTGKEVIPAQFKSALSFSDGLAAVSDNDHGFGYIDKSGRLVIPYKYEIAGSFSEDLAMVRLDGKYKIIDKAGNEIADIKKPAGTLILGIFKDGVAWCTITNIAGGSYHVLIDKNGNELTSSKYTEVNDFNNGLAKVYNGNYGMVDKNGKEIITSRYANIIQYDNGWIVANGAFSFNHPTWYAVFNKKGELIIEGNNLSFSPLSENLLAVSSVSKDNDIFNRSIHLIDINGKTVVSSGKYLDVSELNDGYALVRAYTGKKGSKDYSLLRYGVIDKNGKELLAPSLNYNTMYYAGKNNIYITVVNGKYGLIKLTGK